MLKGHVFNLQTFTSEAFALFIDKFLNGRSGVAKGCSLSNTTTSATIGEGYFVVRGRFLQIISGETITNITANGYYSLVCEIDLSKTNTADQLNQATIKVISNTSAYPTLTQQDITGTGTVYQYEFARFRVESGSITNFTDKRTFVDFTTIYDVIQNESQKVLDDIEQALQNVLDGSAYLLKTGGTINGDLEVTGNITGSLTGTASNSQKLGGKDANDYKLKGDFAIITGTLEEDTEDTCYKKVLSLPSGFTKDNCVIVSVMTQNPVRTEQWVTGTMFSSSSYVIGGMPAIVYITNTQLTIKVKNIVLTNGESAFVGKGGSFNFKVIIMKIS